MFNCKNNLLGRLQIPVFVILCLAGIFLFLPLKISRAESQPKVIINEVAWMGSMNSTADEWIELKNNTNEDINLTGWKLTFDNNSNDVVYLQSTTTILVANSYYLLERTDDNSVPGIAADWFGSFGNGLNNNGMKIQLIDGDGYIVDEIVCADNKWPAGLNNTKNNIKLTMERTENLGWQSSTENNGTPKAQNSTGYQNQNNENSQSTTTTAVIINELLPNPNGSDDNEWLELKNLSTTTIDLINWKISDLAGTDYVITNTDFSTTTISALGFFILPKSITKISLNNSGGETARLFDSQNNLISEISYSETAKDDFVWARDESGVWHWSTTQTLGAENIITEPVVPGSGGGSSYEPKKYPSQIKINEIFPNPPGSDADEWIELKSFEGEMFSLIDWQIKNNLGTYIIKESDFKWPYLEANGFFLLARVITNLNLKNAGGDKIQLIDPTGKIVSEVKYSGEVIESLAYMMDKNKNWQWTTTPTPLAENIFTKNNLMPKAYFEVSGLIQPESEILLDASESYDPEGSNLIYEWHFNAPVLFNNSATTTFATTTSAIKIFLDKTATLKIGLKVIDEENGFDEQTQNIKPEKIQVFWWDEEDKAATDLSAAGANKSAQATKSVSKVSGANIIKTDLDNIKNLALGSAVETTGIVSVLPGVLGANIFYVAGSGVQIYCYKKDFPEFKVGDQIKIIGELSSAYGELRIKIKDKSAVQILNFGSAPEPEEISLGDLEDGDDFVGSLVKVAGEITSVKTDFFWLDDGEGEIKVVIKPTTGLSLKNLAVATGDKAEVVGILSKTSSGLRLLPRGAEDLIIEKILGQATAKTNLTNKIFGQNILKYFLALTLAIIVILVVVIFRIKQKTKDNLLPKK